MKKIIFLFVITIFIYPVNSNAAKGDNIKKREIILNASKIEKNARLINLLYNSSEKVISLDNTELIEDDAPALGVPEKYFGIEYRKNTAPWQEELKKGIKIKKILNLTNSKAWSGRLLFFGREITGNTEPLHISVNGCEIIRPATKYAYPYAKQYTDIVWLRWYFVDLPIGALKDGENEIIMWVESKEPTWRICISLEEEYKHGSLTRQHHPNRSMKSVDGGKTWRDSKLGINNSEDGEYDIRFSLDRFVPSGKYISPIMNLVNYKEVINGTIDSLTSKMFFNIEIPEKTTAKIMLRFSSSPLLNNNSWTAWKEVKANVNITEYLASKRYFQWKVEMSTSDPLKSPLIKGIKITSRWKDNSKNKKYGIVEKVIHNGKVIIPSYEFKYENLNHPELKKFRKKFKLDKIIEGAKSEFEIMMRLLHWAYRIPVNEIPYSWNGNNIAIYKKSRADTDELEKKYGKEDIWNWIPLETEDKSMPELQWNYKKRRRDAMCNYSNLSLQAALMSMGYQARYININSEAEGGHEITEVWSNEFNKWIYMDATRDYYYFDLETGLPMNLLEVHNKLAEKLSRIEIWQHPFIQEEGPELIKKIKIGMREGHNLYSIKEDAQRILGIMGYFRIMLRNDFYSHPYPIPTAQGYTMWGWDGYLNHYDEKFPKRTEFQRQSNRFVDFYEPLNQSEVFLSETDQQGILKVGINTHTPDFKSILVKLNDGEWIEQYDLIWNWKLKAGVNTIKVRTKTLENILGPISCLKVTFNP